MDSSNGSRAARARSFMALFAMLAMGLALAAPPAAAAPFAYVANEGPNTVSVIDTATNTVVATVPVAPTPIGVAVAPDGKHVYVINSPPRGGGSVSVIDTATNTVVGTPILVGISPQGVAVTPDGKHAYVTNFISNNVSVIDTATNAVVATVPVGNFPAGVGIVPPPPPGVHFLAFVAQLQIRFGRAHSVWHSRKR